MEEGKPGPIQTRVLEALQKTKGLTGPEIAAKAKLSVGSVYGATSGMVNCRDRHWLALSSHDNINDRIWAITLRGKAALNRSKYRTAHSVIYGLLEIAKIAMPDTFYATDPRVEKAREWLGDPKA